MNSQTKCKNCSLSKECHDDFLSWFFLFIGILATIALRVVNLISGYGVFWVKFSWYIGVGGFLAFFLYKFKVDRSFQKKLMLSGIINRIVNNEKLENRDYDFLKNTICKLRSKKDSINYFVIFFSSAVSLVLAIYQDFFK